MNRKRKAKRIVALLLCIVMMIPAQGITALAAATDETSESVDVLPAPEPRIEETLVLEPIKKKSVDEGIIYWNPGAVLPEALATASNAPTATTSDAKTATASNVKKGNNNADGRTPATPVKTLDKAFERAEELMEEEGLLPADITIYAMSPMEIGNGQLYALNGGNISIKSWPGRSYTSDVIFYLNGGQLILMNVWLESGNQDHEKDESRLIYVQGGAFQMGENVNLDGRIVLDYRSGSKIKEWDLATPSASTASNAVAAKAEQEDFFDLSEYIMNSDEDSIELVEDRISANTWQSPIVELLEGFDGGTGEYILELLEEGSARDIELGRTLYSDRETEEEFLSFFTLVWSGADRWSLQVETQITGQVHNTSLYSTQSEAEISISTFSRETEILTQKILMATRASGKTIYWNPGGNITIGNNTYYAGIDGTYDGTTETFPVKTWEWAVARAEGGTVVCMQTLNLGSGNAYDYLPQQGDGSYVLQSSSTALMTTLSTWDTNPQPAIFVPEGEVLVLNEVVLAAYSGDSAQLIVCDKGTIMIDKAVTAETGYIQVTAYPDMGERVKVICEEASVGGTITLFFSGINDNFEYCYTDVVFPDGPLADRIANASNPADERVAVGRELQARFKLHTNHGKNVINGEGTSKFNWSLRPDTTEDDGIANPQNLELYALYYFQAIYLNGETGKGSDSYYGATCQYPVATWARAQERWAYEMTKSVEARRAAYAENRGAEYIEENYPLPKTIYICGTVTVGGAEVWEQYLNLASQYRTDYDGSTIVTEVVSHMDKDDGGVLSHEIPKTLVKVNGDELTIQDVIFRNVTDDVQSVTIQVEEGGKLSLNGSTLLTGKRLAKGNITAKEVTLGTHVKVLKGSFVMEEQWVGAIEKRQHGVNGAGAETKITMNGGFIRENNSFEQNLYDTGQTGHKYGAGVLLSNRAEFTMNGGKITKNSVYQYGAGVYMVDTGTAFTMIKGEISDNKMSVRQVSNSSTTPVRGYGTGIYAGAGTNLKIGNGINPAEDVLISGNGGYLSSGTGIWTDGELIINQGTITKNYAGGYTTSVVSYGIGIYVGSNGKLTMNGGQVTGNYTTNSGGSFGSAQGAGIYITTGSTALKAHTINQSVIKENKITFEYSSVPDYSGGGGIYISNAQISLRITDSEISENHAHSGGGVFISSTSNLTNVTIGNTVIEKNKAYYSRSNSSSGTGGGGGIYYNGYGSLYLLDGVKIINNIAGRTGGGGIYRYSGSYSISHLYMMATSPGRILVNNNETSDCGGGIFLSGAIAHIQNVEINRNMALTGGGLYTALSVRGYFNNMIIDGNQATNGGGFYAAHTQYEPYYFMCLNDCAITNNTAQSAGGGIYNANGLTSLTESSSGKFVLKGNQANSGGAVYAVGGSLYMNIDGEVQNNAQEQGSNLYVTTADVYILAGHFKQPEAADRTAGVYNIYVNDTGTIAAKKFFDMSLVTTEKKDVAKPEVLYLNTANSYLTFLDSPPYGIDGAFPIDLNETVFKVGSVVAKPANLSTVGVLRPDAALNNSVTDQKSYPSLQDAALHLSYYSGGALPRRTHLGGFADATVASLTNLTLVGEGVYLSGEGDDSLSGASPDEAVRTFDMAKVRLQERIEENKDGEGFSPIIYICGQVEVDNSEPVWELNYDDNLFAVKNANYTITEELYGDTAYPAQVRRFASFVDAPMIMVSGSVASPVAFKTGKIIIDGMADAVIKTDQGDKSPVIYGSDGSVITLTGESQITNNYYSGVKTYGTLLLTGEAGETNKQLYNHHGFFAWLHGSAKIQMLGYARIISDGTVTKVSSSGGHYGIYTQQAEASVSMKNHSSIEHGASSALMSDGCIRSNGEHTSVVMENQARIINRKESISFFVILTGANSEVVMRDEAQILNDGGLTSYGIYLSGANSTLKMSGEGNITSMANSLRYAVWVGSADGQIIMEDTAEIRQTGTATSLCGICLNSVRVQVTLKDHARIKYDMAYATTGDYGIYSWAAATGSKVELQDYATISGSDTVKLYYGIFVDGGSNLQILMNRNTGAREEDSAQIVNVNYGIIVGTVGNFTLLMGEKSEINRVGFSAIEITQTASADINVEMTGSSRICKSSQAVYISGTLNNPINFLMAENAAIEQNTYAFREYESITRGTKKLTLIMKNKARISGNYYGINLAGCNGFTQDSGYHIITLEDQAVIGGTSYYSSEDNTSGNMYSGIYANSPIQLTMSGSSKISGNGWYDTNTSVYANGVYLTRRTESSYYRSGTALITLNDSASICDNKGGVHIATISEITYPNFPNTCIIELNGIKGDGSLAYPSIQRNTDAVYLGGQATLRLKGGATLGDTVYSSDARSLDGYGYLELDGRSTVKGLIYLRNGGHPITMTAKVDVGMPQEYRLYLAEGFLGQIVVKPEKPNGNPVNDVTDVSDQITYFKKAGADGMAAAKDMVASAPNIILLGENQIYLSVNGDDSNTGNSKVTPVRTFRRAKELLEGGVNGGYFTSGANILIYNSNLSGTGVVVKSGDDDWSFDTGGYVTNLKSGARWKPLVIRDQSFTGTMISISNGTADANSVTFRNITIDGGSEEEITATNHLMAVNSNSTAVLKDGAVLQNNKAIYTSLITTGNTVGVYVSGGTLEIDGGIIQGMVRERSGTSNLSSTHYLSSAIWCSGTASASGRVILKSGQITENQVLGINLTSGANRCGAVYLDGMYANMEMSGGQITNNIVSLKSASIAGAVFNFQGNLEISGGIIRDNQGGQGSGIYHYGDSTSGKLIFSGGKITGNTINVVGQNYASKGEYSPIYIANYGMELKGGAAELQDPVFLASTNGIIKVTNPINQSNRQYCIYLNIGTGVTLFKKGSIVVQPDGSNVMDTTPYLSYFDVKTNTYILDRGRINQTPGANQGAALVDGVKENQCLLLMKAVYLDSEKGVDSNPGLTPARAVRTFDRAKSIGATADSSAGTVDAYNHYVIYISGKAINMATEAWTLPDFAYMCRYTGFTVYSDRSGTPEAETMAYFGPLIEPAGDLTLQNISIYGRRGSDASAINGDSLVRVKSGITVKVQEGTVLADNNNVGSYLGSEGVENLTSKGGAFQVEAGGILQMDGGGIQNTQAAYGSAVYLGASAADQTDAGRGRLLLDGAPDIQGKIYLEGNELQTAAYVEPTAGYHPASPLQISIKNDYTGRPVIQYPTSVIPGAAELEYYLFDDAIKAMYDIVNRAGAGNILELVMRDIIYLDGKNGNDANDGSTPSRAFKTLKKVYSSIGEDESNYGIVVFVVNTVTVPEADSGPTGIELMNIQVKNGNGTSHYQGYYADSSGLKINVQGQVYFKRYAQPQGYTTGTSVYSEFSAPTLTETLFDVKDRGTLTLRGVYLDGHSQAVNNSNLTLVAEGVVAMSPLVTVEAGGTINCMLADGVVNGVSTAALFTNNFNANQKDKEVGILNSSPVIEGSGAGIELLDGGKGKLEYTQFTNLQLGEEVVAGGTDVYTNGDLHISLKTYFGGTVYLEGQGTANGNQGSSRFISIDEYGKPVETDFHILMRDPYIGRTVIAYPDMTATTNAEPPLTDIGYYRLEERVKDYFCLNRRSSARYIFELQVPVAVYVDGINGDDGINLEDAVNRAAGSTPKNPIQSLKRAFELLNIRSGNTIYVVGTVQISENTTVTGMSYNGEGGNVSLGNTSKVNITRYLQPDFAAANYLEAYAAGYDVEDFTGVLLHVKNGAAVEVGSGVYFDGHSNPKTNSAIGEYDEMTVVSRFGEAKSPLLTVEAGSILSLLEGVTLLDNNNTYGANDSAGRDGGAIANSGTVNVNGGLFENNKARKGSVVYQGGIFNIQSKPENLGGHVNSFYLETENSKTAENPVWGRDYVISTAVAIPDSMIFDVDMDHAVKGRPVVRFIDSLAYSPDADAEHEHFRPGSSVSPELFLVEAETDAELLELQNWQILKVEVPANIYLVLSRKGEYNISTTLRGVMKESPAGSGLLTAPEYRVENKGRYDAKVSISSFENQSQSAGINTVLYPPMNLTGSVVEALNSSDIYLAVKGLNNPSITGTGFGVNETSLKPYGETVVTAAPVVLGTLTSGTSGDFIFIGAVGYGFVEQYLDPGFVIDGFTGVEAQAHMDGTSSANVVNARAKYLLRYKVEIDPSRREIVTP